MRFRQILVPVDFSAQSRQAGIIAVQLANRYDADVKVLHVDPFPGAAALAVEPVYIPPDLFGGLQEDYNRRVQLELEALIAELTEYKMPNVQLTSDRRMADVVDGILAYAKESGTDLVVMGSSGMTAAARLILGSVADKVSRMASCPVLVTRAVDPEERPAHPFRRVLVGIDYSHFSGSLARLAAAAVVPGGSLELVHVWAAPYASPLDAGLGMHSAGELTEAIEQARAAEADRLDQFRTEHALESASCYVTSAQIDGVSGALLERAGEIQADLVVLGAHAREQLSDRILGTVADRVLRQSQSSVLLLPQEALRTWSP